MTDYQVESVTVSYGMTISLGNYEFIRIDAGVTLKANKQAASEAEAVQLKDSMFKEASASAQLELRDRVVEVKSKIKKGEIK